MKAKLNLLLVIIISTSINAQKKELVRDSIVKYFEINEPLIAHKIIFSKLNEGFFLDVKSFYKNKEIENLFLKCLDRKKYKEFEIQKDLKAIKEYFVDIDYFKSILKSYLNENKRKIKVDSILKSEKLIQKYKDSVLENQFVFLNKERNYKKYIPPLYVITRLKYRAVYDSIKKWSKENSSLDLYDELLKYNDPDAIMIFDKKVENYVKSNGEKDIYANFKKSNYENFIRDCKTGHTFSKLTELIKIDKKNIYFYGHILNLNGEMVSEDSYINENYSILYRTNFFNYISKYKLPYEKLIKYSNNIKLGDLSKEKKFMKDNNKEIIKAILDISKEMKKEEEYWMINMPFYRK